MVSDRQGRRERRGQWERWGVGAFVDEEGGFTTVAVALALLVALALVLSLAQVEWVDSHSSDVQAVADATAIAGCQVVRMYTEIAQVLDACVVTLGMAGVFVMGAGLVMSFIPFVNGIGLSITEFGTNIFTARKEFATSVSQGLRTVEDKLPLLIYADSFTTAEANSSDVKYVGLALPFPDEGKSDFGLPDDVDPSDMEEANKKTAEASEKAKEAQEKMETAIHDGWLADCGSEGTCMRERALTLAGLDTRYWEESEWDFGKALERARSYYAERQRNERPASDSIEERANSAMREAYFRYAIDELSKGSYEENGNGEPTRVELPTLARNTDDTRKTWLYDTEPWPCTLENGERVIHAVADCPGATGPADGTATLKEMKQEGGTVLRCDVCRLTVGQMGRVASISSHASSGFEYHWALEVDAATRWKDGKKELDESEAEREEASDAGVDAFENALALFKTPRVKLCPPGAWGCIAIVCHGGVSVEELENGFTGGVDLPSGVAIAGATLAPDDAAGGNSLISHVFDSVEAGDGGIFEPILGFILNLWSGLLEFYNGAAKGIGDVTDGMFKGLETFGLSWIGDPIKNALTGVVEGLGLQPADLTQKKPVLCNTDDILKKDGNATTAKILDYIYVIDPDKSLWEAIEAVAGKAFDDFKAKLKEKEIVLGKFNIPLINQPFELKVPVGQLLDAIGVTS